MLLFLGCVHRVAGPPKEIELVTRCLVKENIVSDLDHRVICDDGSVVVLPRMIPVGSEVVFDSYYEDDDSTTIHGYIKKVYEPIQGPKTD